MSEQQIKMYQSRYRSERLLGEGSNGKTWLGTDVITGEKIAIKTLKLSAAENLKSFELFEREAALLASIKVDGVPKFYDSYVAKSPDEDSYIVQEYVDAPSVEWFLKEGLTFTEQDTLWVVIKVAQILSVLHSAYTPPIIHRDIKPGNILCMPMSNDGVPEFSQATVYLIDFGAVANPQKSSGGSTVAGTFGYMAPEQYMGTVSPQTDIYSLGATAVHMITGCAPYDMPSDVFKLQYKEKLAEVAPNTSQLFVDFIDKLIDPEPSKRPASARDVILAAQRVLQGLTAWDGSLDEPEEKQHSIADLSEGMTRMPKTKAEGIVRCIRDFNYNAIVEYTFKANGKEWCGAVPDYQLKTKFNVSERVTVVYDEDNPVNNMLDMMYFKQSM